MPKIFISYRREDSSYASGEIARRFASVFGKKSVVLDVDNIPPGQDFRDHIQHHLEACDLLVAVIGKNWLTARDENGQLRIQNPRDWVRIELETALGRESKIPVIPVLLDNVPPLKVEQLPDNLKELAYRQAHAVRPPTDFDHDVDTLIQKIKAQKATSLRWPLVVGSTAMIIAASVLLAILFLQRPIGGVPDHPAPATKQPSQISAASEKLPGSVPAIEHPEQNSDRQSIAIASAETTSPTLSFQKVTSADGKFTVEMPGKPTDTTTDVSGWKHHQSAVLIVNKERVYRYVVSYMDLSGVDLSDPQKLIQLYQIGCRKGQKILEEKPISLGTRKIPGRDYRIETGTDVMVHEWLLLDGARLYNVFVATNVKDFISSKNANRLFDTFEITR
jgi:hypothetical protein